MFAKASLQGCESLGILEGRRTESKSVAWRRTHVDFSEGSFVKFDIPMETNLIAGQEAWNRVSTHVCL